MGADWPAPSEWTRIVLEATVLFVLGVLLGLTINYRVAMNVLSGKIAEPPTAGQVESQSPLPVPVALDGVRELLAAGALPVDARTREAYLEGHLPGAVSLSLGDFAQEKSAFIGRVPPERTLVVYCSGYGCPDSFDLSVLLLEEGYLDVRLFEGGLPEWRDAGLPVEGGGP